MAERDMSRKVNWMLRANTHQYTITQLQNRRGIPANTPRLPAAEDHEVHGGFFVDSGCGEGFSLSSSLFPCKLSFHQCSILVCHLTGTICQFDAAVPRDSNLHHFPQLKRKYLVTLSHVPRLLYVYSRISG